MHCGAYNDWVIDSWCKVAEKLTGLLPTNEKRYKKILQQVKLIRDRYLELHIEAFGEEFEGLWY